MSAKADDVPVATLNAAQTSEGKPQQLWTLAELDKVTNAFGAELKRTLQQQRGVIEFARVALPGLVDVCAAKTGQSYKLRALLYSAWNGQATSLLDGLTGLDWAIKKDVLTVLLAFGCEPGGGTPGFFYDALADAFKAAGLFEWFCEASTASDEPE